MKLPVTPRAVMQRLTRKIRTDGTGRDVAQDRRGGAHKHRDRFYIFDSQAVLEEGTLEELARKHGVLRGHEVME